MSRLATVVLGSVLAFTACYSEPREAISDAVRPEENPLTRRFRAADDAFEQAIGAFNNSPSDTPSAFELAEDRLAELRSAFDRWSPLVDELVSQNVAGVPEAELLAWRDAAGEWIEAQETLTAAVAACDSRPACLEGVQKRELQSVVAATNRAREIKEQFLTARPR